LSLELAFQPMVTHREAARDVRLRSMMEDHFDVVWRALRRLGVPDAGVDDAAQQVFLVASRRLEEIDRGGERAYLLGVTVRVASDARRAVRRRREVSMDDLMAESPPAAAAPAAIADPPLPDEMLDHQRALATLGALLDEMPTEMRDAFVLFELEELSAPQVAQVLGVPVGTVASRVRRAREHFRRSLLRRGAP
jgi:RNA polymerase sigma-70 factor, ECF subfamily